MNLISKLMKKLFPKEHEEPADTLSEASEKWNLLWNLWAYRKLESPIAELMTYDAEVNNGGHGQYFLNLEENADLQAHVETVSSILPPHLAENLKRAYRAYKSVGQPDYDEAEDRAAFTECDMLYYENSAMIAQILQRYADGLTLPKSV